MRKVELTVYYFNELNGTARIKALSYYRANFSFDAWAVESLASIITFLNRFKVKLLDYSVVAHEPIRVTTDATPHNFLGVRLSQFKPDYMPTGYCLDSDLWGTFYEGMADGMSAYGAFIAAVEAGFKAWREDLEYQDSDAYIEDWFMSNEYEFMPDGSIYYDKA